MKKYFVSYWRDFANTYSLLWTDSQEMEAALPSNARRIPRQEAERLCREERVRRKKMPDFSFYATASIYPADYNPDLHGDIASNPKYRREGYIWEKV